MIDRPGVLAAVAGVFGSHGVSISAMEQEGLPDDAGADLVFITHLAVERDLQATLHDLRGLDAVLEVGSVIRVIGDSPRPGERHAPRVSAVVKYVSTRGSAPVLGFGDVLLAGLARDGGLYVPRALADAGARAAVPRRRGALRRGRRSR